MTATPANMVSQIRTARKVNRVSQNVLVYSTKSGDTSRPPRAMHPAVCAMVRIHGEHVLVTVMADLPGDRSVGHCECGHYIDTGTWDERNGE